MYFFTQIQIPPSLIRLAFCRRLFRTKFLDSSQLSGTRSQGVWVRAKQKFKIWFFGPWIKMPNWDTHEFNLFCTSTIFISSTDRLYFDFFGQTLPRPIISPDLTKGRSTEAEVKMSKYRKGRTDAYPNWSMLTNGLIIWKTQRNKYLRAIFVGPYNQRVGPFVTI
mgnify:CR=1 FL=1